MTARGSISAESIAEVARASASDAGVTSELLGDFLRLVSDAVDRGTPPTKAELRRYRRVGDRAARRGVALRALLDLYLSASWRVWPHLAVTTDPRAEAADVVIAGHVMLHAADDVAAELVEGYQLARRSLIRQEEASRREFFDDLLSGSGDVAGLLVRATAFGLDFSGPYAVAVIRSEQPLTDVSPITGALERAIQGSKGDAEPLIVSKDGHLVVMFAAPDRTAIEQVTLALEATLSQGRHPGKDWRIGVGRARLGPGGLRTSFREAEESLDLAASLGLGGRSIDVTDVLAYRLLLRDHGALVDLVRSVLLPLAAARGGAEPLLRTLEAYFAAGGNTAQVARSLHLSVRAVTYRMSRVRGLTGQNPDDAAQRFTLQSAVLGAQLLRWPSVPLPE